MPYAPITIPNGYKQTEVGIIPNDWVIGHNDDFSTKVGSGITPTGCERVYKKEVRTFLRSQNMVSENVRAGF